MYARRRISVPDKSNYCKDGEAGGMRPRSIVALPARPVLNQLAKTLRAACRLFTSTPPAGAHCTACKTRTDVPEGYKTNAVAA